MLTSISFTVDALYIFLSVSAFALVMWFAVRPAFVRLINIGARNDGASQFAFFATFALIILSSWFTQAVGVHAIFGAFLVGLITPHDHGYALHLSEKMEDVVEVLLLPLVSSNLKFATSLDLNIDSDLIMQYFAITGIQTRLDFLK